MRVGSYSLTDSANGLATEAASGRRNLAAHCVKEFDMPCNRLLLITMTALLASWSAHALPSPECRTLARTFGDNPRNLDQSELARLRKCVSDELSAVMVSDRLVPPAAAAPRPQSAVSPSAPRPAPPVMTLPDRP